MARRRRPRPHEDRDDHLSRPSLARAGPQALHRASVLSLTADRRQFHPYPELIHAIQKAHAKLVLAPEALRKAKARFAPPPQKRPNRFSRLYKFVAGRGFETRAKRSSLAAYLRVAAPRNVRLCVQRKTRREVIFAAGYGGSKKISRRRRTNDFTNVRCK